MARFEDEAFTPAVWHHNGISAANAPLVVTRPSDGPDRQHYITSMYFSFNGAPVAPVEVQLKSGATVVHRAFVPAAGLAPVVIQFTHPLVMSADADTTLEIPAGGASIISAAGFDGYDLRT